MKCQCTSAPQTASTSLPGTGGAVTYSQRIEFGGWSHANDALSVQLYNHTQLSAPIIGTIDAFIEPITISTATSGGNGAAVGQYLVLKQQALGLAAQTYEQDLGASMVAFKVVTPYGAIVVTPKFAITRHLNLSPTPPGWPSARA